MEKSDDQGAGIKRPKESISNFPQFMNIRKNEQNGPLGFQ